MIDNDEKTKKLEEILGCKINNRDLFTTAFVHRSYLNESKECEFSSNERFEFLGDAILQFLSSEHLFTIFPEFPEGKLTNIRAAVVCTESLAETSKELEYGQFLMLSRGEEVTGGREREYILANTFEAVLGALYLDSGITNCRKFLKKTLFKKIQKVIDDQSFKDAKSVFQELSQEEKGVTPTYKVLDDWGPDHNKTFKVGVFLEDKIYGEGLGKSKQEAQQDAAKKALENWGDIK